MSTAPPPSGTTQTAKRDEGRPLQQALRLVRHIDAHACPKCSAQFAPGARFCTDCGESLTPGCPACSATVVAGDFCEACGHWLLDAQCRFCYAELADGARFCETCGCNQSGLVCQRCQTTGFFDFCAGCGDPVSEKGQILSQQAVQSPELEQVLQSMRQMQAELVELADKEASIPPPPRQMAPAAPSRLVPPEALQALKDMGAAAKAQQGLDSQRAAQAQAEARAAAEQASRAAAEAQSEAQRQSDRREAMAQAQPARLSLSAQLREAQRAVEALLKADEGVTYPTPQEARSQFMQVRLRLAALGKVPSGWRCVAYHACHATPNECANPALGGTWIF